MTEHTENVEHADHTDLVTALVENGPCPKHDLPDITNAAMSDGVISYFTVPTATLTNGVSVGNDTTIFYSPAYHTKTEVIQGWAEENSEAVENNDNLNLHRQISTNHPEGWKEASREVLGPFDPVYGTGESPEFRDCPFCEEKFEGDYPGHLPCKGV